MPDQVVPSLQIAATGGGDIRVADGRLVTGGDQFTYGDDGKEGFFSFIRMTTATTNNTTRTTASTAEITRFVSFGIGFPFPQSHQVLGVMVPEWGRKGAETVSGTR